MEKNNKECLFVGGEKVDHLKITYPDVKISETGLDAEFSSSFNLYVAQCSYCFCYFSSSVSLLWFTD